MESLARAIRVAYDPPSAAELRGQCKGSAAFLARQLVGAVHRVLDASLPNHKYQASLLSRCHADLTLWQLLLRVAPRQPDDIIGDIPEPAAVTDAASLLASVSSPAAAPASSRASAPNAPSKAYVGEERTLRLAALEALNALVALQPTACGGRLAVGNALPHLVRWLAVSLHEYLTLVDGGAPTDVIAHASRLNEKLQGEGSTKGQRRAGGASSSDTASDTEGGDETADEEPVRQRSASGAPAPLLYLSLINARGDGAWQGRVCWCASRPDCGGGEGVHRQGRVQGGLDCKVRIDCSDRLIVLPSRRECTLRPLVR